MVHTHTHTHIGVKATIEIEQQYARSVYWLFYGEFTCALLDEEKKTETNPSRVKWPNGLQYVLNVRNANAVSRFKI